MTAQTQLLFAYATDEAAMRALLDSYKGITLVDYRDPELQTRRRSARGVADWTDAVVSPLGWDHAGVDKRVTTQDGPLSLLGYDPQAIQIGSPAHRSYVSRVLPHTEQGLLCWEVCFDQLPFIAERVNEVLSSRLAAQ